MDSNNLSLYAPSRYEIYRMHIGSGSYQYFLKYNRYQFSIKHKPGSEQPFSFEIILQGPKNETRILPKKTFDRKLGLALVAEIFYQNPIKLTTIEQLATESLLDLGSVMERAKRLFSGNWRDELFFGIRVFYEWVKIYYQNDHINSFKQLFDRDIWQM